MMSRSFAMAGPGGLVSLVLAAATAGCTTCTESEETAFVTIPDARCDVGRCAEWRTGPCEETCAAFLEAAGIVEVTGCEPPVTDPDRPGELLVECRYVLQTCETSPRLASGRPQLGHLPSGPLGGEDPIGRFFARAAEAEHSSVFAFRELAHDLAQHGAPASLVKRCRDAARDEDRHRRVMVRLARARGVIAPSARSAPSRWPSLASLARENAASGCVDERWSAALTIYAAHFANDAGTRADLRAVASDEVRHAELAEDLDAFVASRLDARGRAAVATARAAAIRALRASLHRTRDSDPLVGAGLFPPRAVRARMFEAVFPDAGGMRCAS
jgi:hypothetical protein